MCENPRISRVRPLTVWDLPLEGRLRPPVQWQSRLTAVSQDERTAVCGTGVFSEMYGRCFGNREASVLLMDCPIEEELYTIRMALGLRAALLFGTF